MLTHILPTICSAFIVVSILVGSFATANAATDKKETTKKTWAVDASHGTYSDTIPIEVPPFREITPKLALTYDSSNGNSELGVGWNLDVLNRPIRHSIACPYTIQTALIMSDPSGRYPVSNKSTSCLRL